MSSVKPCHGAGTVLTSIWQKQMPTAGTSCQSLKTFWQTTEKRIRRPTNLSLPFDFRAAEARQTNPRPASHEVPHPTAAQQTPSIRPPELRGDVIRQKIFFFSFLYTLPNHLCCYEPCAPVGSSAPSPVYILFLRFGSSRSALWIAIGTASGTEIGRGRGSVIGTGTGTETEIETEIGIGKGTATEIVIGTGLIEAGGLSRHRALQLSYPIPLLALWNQRTN